MKKGLRYAILILWAAGIALQILLIMMYYEILQVVRGMTIFPYRHYVLFFSILGIMLLICAMLLSIIAEAKSSKG